MDRRTAVQVNIKGETVMEFKVFEELWFPTPIWECQVSSIDNTAIKEYCLKVREQKPGVQVSNKGGWHSSELLQPIPTDLEKLLLDIQHFTNDVCARHTGTSDLVIGNIWININGPYDYNMPHDHQGSILSGVYYVSVPAEGMGDLVLHRGDTAEFFLTSKVTRQPTKVNLMSASKPAKESTFYIFPSWTVHHVERNETDLERISIAFNLVHKNLL